MILFIVGALAIMMIRPDHRMEVVATALLTIVVVCSGLLVSQRRKAQRAAGVIVDAA
ncbi:hypothetical protein D3C78_1611490 [compost metagenome]